MEYTVRTFNSLHRPRDVHRVSVKGKIRQDNHWIFGILRVHRNTPTPGDFVVAVMPANGMSCLWGPGRFPHVRDISETAEAMVPFLLKAFNIGFWRQGPMPNETRPFAPWTWAIWHQEAPELAHALERRLRHHGVMEELCRVGICSDDEMNGLLDGLNIIRGSCEAVLPPSSGDATRCHECGIRCEIASKPL